MGIMGRRIPSAIRYAYIYIYVAYLLLFFLYCFICFARSWESGDMLFLLCAFNWRYIYCQKPNESDRGTMKRNHGDNFVCWIETRNERRNPGWCLLNYQKKTRVYWKRRICICKIEFVTKPVYGLTFVLRSRYIFDNRFYATKLKKIKCSQIGGICPWLSSPYIH